MGQFRMALTYHKQVMGHSYCHMNWQHHVEAVSPGAHHFSSIVCFVQRTLCSGTCVNL